MPELPEVETIRRGLQRKIKNKQIKDIVINVDKIVKKPYYSKKTIFRRVYY